MSLDSDLKNMLQTALDPSKALSGQAVPTSILKAVKSSLEHVMTRASEQLPGFYISLFHDSNKKTWTFGVRKDARTAFTITFDEKKVFSTKDEPRA